METSVETLLFGLFSALIGALLAYFIDFRRSRRERKEAREALKASIAAEIYCNIVLVIERIKSIWSELDEGAEHIPAFSMDLQSVVFDSTQDNLGLLNPETAAQTIFLYASFKDILMQHKLLKSYNGDIQGGYGTHRMHLHKIISETNDDALELIRILNGRGIGEYDAAFDLSPEQQRVNIGRVMRTQYAYVARAPKIVRLFDALRIKLNELFSR